MLMRMVRTLENRIFTVQILTENFGIQDVRLMRTFGEPVIEIGGTFGVAPNTFILPGSPRRLRSQFPVVQQFDGTVTMTPPAQDRATVWGNTIVTRIQTALATLRGNLDTFTTERAETL